MTRDVSTSLDVTRLKRWKQQPDFFWLDDFPMSTREISEAQVPDTNAHQPLRSKTEVLEHATNLPIDPLLQNDTQFRRRDLSRARRASAFAVEEKAAKEVQHKLGRDWFVECHFVFLFNFKTWMRQTLREVAVIREQKKAFALRIEPADVRERGKLRRQQIEDGLGRMPVAPRANESRRFIERNVNVCALVQALAVHFHVIGCGGLKMKIGARLSVHRDAARSDKLIGAPP